MEKYPFGYPLTVFKTAIEHDTEANDLFKKVVSHSFSITVGKIKIVKTKRLLNAAVVGIKHYKLLRSCNLPIPTGDTTLRYGYDTLRKFVEEYTRELHERQQDLKKIYIAHNKAVKELKNAIDKFARTCAIRHTHPATTIDDTTDVAHLKSEEQTLTTLNLSRIGVLTLIKKLSDEIKTKPNCNKFTITINADVAKE